MLIVGGNKGPEGIVVQEERKPMLHIRKELSMSL